MNYLKKFSIVLYMSNPAMNPAMKQVMKEMMGQGIETVKEQVKENPKQSIGGGTISSIVCIFIIYLIYRAISNNPFFKTLKCFMFPFFCAPKSVKKGVVDVFKGKIGAHRKIKMTEAKCRKGDIYAKFRNKTARCIKVAVTSKDNKVYLGQKANNACVNTYFNVCIPEGGFIKVKGTTGKRRTSYLSYEKLKQSGYNWKKNKPINIRLPFNKRYAKFRLPEGDVYNK
jgi:hypothetical protein